MNHGMKIHYKFSFDIGDDSDPIGQLWLEIQMSTNPNC